MSIIVQIRESSGQLVQGLALGMRWELECGSAPGPTFCGVMGRGPEGNRTQHL